MNDSEFRLSGKDQQFNSYLAFRRLDIALLNLWRTIMDPAALSKAFFLLGLTCLFLPSFFYGDWNGMAAILVLGMAFVGGAVFLARIAGDAE